MWAPTFFVHRHSYPHHHHHQPINKYFHHATRWWWKCSALIYLWYTKDFNSWINSCLQVSEHHPLNNLPVLLIIFVLFASKWRPTVITDAVLLLLLLVLKQVTHFIPFAVIRRVNKVTEYTMRSEYSSLLGCYVESWVNSSWCFERLTGPSSSGSNSPRNTMYMNLQITCC